MESRYVPACPKYFNAELTPILQSCLGAGRSPNPRGSPLTSRDGANYQGYIVRWKRVVCLTICCDYDGSMDIRPVYLSTNIAKTSDSLLVGMSITVALPSHIDSTLGAVHQYGTEKRQLRKLER